MMKTAWRHGGDKDSAAAAASDAAAACVHFKGITAECLESCLPSRGISDRFIFKRILSAFAAVSKNNVTFCCPCHVYRTLGLCVLMFCITQTKNAAAAV